MHSKLLIFACITLTVIFFTLTPEANASQSYQLLSAVQTSDNPPPYYLGEAVTVTQTAGTIPLTATHPVESIVESSEVPLSTAAVQPRVYIPIVGSASSTALILESVSNADGDAFYFVTWAAQAGASLYSLEEDDNAAFTSPEVVYSGTATTWSVSALRAAGVYYYRVRALVGATFGAYSNVVSVTVATGAWINTSNRQAVREFYIARYISDTIFADWTGDLATCIAGTTSAEFRTAVLLRVNYYRAIAGVPARITLNADYNVKAQAAAVMMSRNAALSHTPPPSWSCYCTNGAEAASNSDLALGIYGPRAVSAYMKDVGSGNYPVGHRRWILYPQTLEMGTGDTPPVGSYWASNVLWVIDSNIWATRPATRDAFVAYPAPGYVPYQVVYPRWSFSYAGADFSTATVSMSSNGNSVSVTKSPVVNGYGENTLVWIPLGLSDSAVWSAPASDTTYRVTISNVKISGQTRSFTYDVTVFVP